LRPEPTNGLLSFLDSVQRGWTPYRNEQFPLGSPLLG
jgi:hypothetical protein